MTAEPTDWHVPLTNAKATLPGPPERGWARLMEHGTMYAGLYAPRGVDDQKPHEQDELYVVLSGSGIFVRAGERRSFGPGDLIFVPAGMEHRFEDFTDDLSTWAMFYGPKGGEGAA